MRITITINGSAHTGQVEPRTLLSDFIRHQAGLTGTRVGCEHGVCGACTVLAGDEPLRSCLMLAVQADGMTLTTVEGLSGADGELSELQQAFTDHHALQCGFCTAGFLASAEALLRRTPQPSESEIREAIAGNLCRCTGYAGIVAAIAAVSARRAASPPASRR